MFELLNASVLRCGVRRAIGAAAPAFVLLALLFSTPTYAQHYNTAIGIRFGPAFGATIQERISKENTLEGLYQQNRDLQFGSLLFELHQPILFTRRFNYYVGIGGHYGQYLNDEAQYAHNSKTDPHFYGATALIGLELTLGRINLSLDYKPRYDILTAAHDPFHTNEVAFSLRFVLVKKPSSKPTLFDLHLFDRKNKDKGSNKDEI